MKYLILILLMLLSGIIIPKLLISNNINSFQYEEKRYAKYALYHTRLAFDDSLEQLLTMQLKVLQVNKVSNKIEQCGFEPESKSSANLIKGDYTAKIQAYTLFAIPFYTYEVHCGNSSRYNDIIL